MGENKPSSWENWKARAHHLKQETYTLYLAVRDRRTPWYAKLFSGAVVAYAFSPIDLVPDFIPVLGYLDDLIFIPLGVAVAVKMIPTDVMQECRQRATQEFASGKPVNYVAGVLIALIWIILVALMIRSFLR
ncbi:MAG: DUF1232 domain-containing protein [Chloroflexi bacterium]|nr:DUF1232 domain-containing protein [Chloroflexota bacterium]